MRKSRHGEYMAAWLVKPSRGTKDAGCEPQLGASEIRSGSFLDLLERDMVGSCGLRCRTLGVNIKGVGR
jgi:hypothetical protein